MTVPVVSEDSYSVRIHVDDVLHLVVYKSDLLGFQAWRDGDRNFSIEYTLSGGDITTEYDSEEKWKAILAGLDKIL